MNLRTPKTLCVGKAASDESAGDRSVELQLEDRNGSGELVGGKSSKAQFRAAVAVIDQRLKGPFDRFAGVEQRDAARGLFQGMQRQRAAGKP